MTYIDPVRRQDIHDPELAELIERSERCGVPGSLFALVVARVPSYGKALLRAMLRSHFDGQVDHGLKEIIRVQLARRAGSRYFAGLRSASASLAGLSEAAIEAGCEDYERSGRFSDKEKWALRYADQMYLNPSNIDAAFYSELKRHFSEAEIMELGAFIAFHYGMQVFMRTLEVS
jgi:alkylhydroperoxidase family enzyme